MSKRFAHTNDVNNNFTSINENSFFVMQVSTSTQFGSMTIPREIAKEFHKWLGEQLGE